MSLFDWFANRRKADPLSQDQQEREIADGLWTKCDACGVLAYTKDLQANQMVCLECGHHMRVFSDDRIAQLADPGSWIPLDEGVQPVDPLGFKDRKSYRDRLKEAQKKSGLSDAVQTGLARLDGQPCVLAIMDFRFMGGSMGSVVGEKITRAIEQATRDGVGAIVLCASGGARMQEGMLSLMQMAKISGALDRHREAGYLYIPVLTHPTTGGVTASFAMLGDLILAEPKALIGFAGRRVIEQTLREKLPDNFQTAEYLQQYGFVDAIVPRTQLKRTLAQLLRMHQKPKSGKAEDGAIAPQDTPQGTPAALPQG
ncbi:MAG: acetyl-CoA carboxylase, carboxyltransferase subunit beta [Cyanophyceae cyanobacterium]